MIHVKLEIEKKYRGFVAKDGFGFEYAFDNAESIGEWLAEYILTVLDDVEKFNLEVWK